MHMQSYTPRYVGVAHVHATLHTSICGSHPCPTRLHMWAYGTPHPPICRGYPCIYCPTCLHLWGLPLYMEPYTPPYAGVTPAYAVLHTSKCGGYPCICCPTRLHMRGLPTYMQPFTPSYVGVTPDICSPTRLHIYGALVLLPLHMHTYLILIYSRGVATVVFMLPRNPPGCRNVGGATQ